MEPYFTLSVQFSARSRQVLELPGAGSGPQPAPRLFRLRQVASRLQAARPELPDCAVDLELLALLNEALRAVADRFLAARHCRVEASGLTLDGGTVTLPGFDAVLSSFVRLFPADAVLRGLAPEILLAMPRGRRLALLELPLLLLQNGNPAARRLRPLFDDAELQEKVGYRSLVTQLDRVLLPPTGTDWPAASLLELLGRPLAAAPDSLAQQLAYVRRHWRQWLPPELLDAIAVGMAVLAEQNRPRGFGPGPSLAPHLGYGPGDAPRFSADQAWMPNVVLIAKSIYVWLDQLTRIYRRPVRSLAAIPEAELDLLARRGFTALWPIGIWERSPASRRVKQLRGNPDAMASAYALFDYQVAEDLGGWAELEQLCERCRQRGIRLACDVVPNHTGIDSRWMQEHPDWFVQLSYPPYPGYCFSGPDLSPNPDLGLFLEDGYWDHSDAAVVFKHLDRRTGQERYIYHGNDGTHLPWNDTAQLNFLLPEVREAMIQTILRVARSMPIIRFDAAMTLVRKHFQRLWFPLPGGGAGVPSRAEHWMSREEFERLLPREFWREVVDRVAAEAPDTLLLAEAFWLMEGFFVGTLGMHRVYNSAFMNMLKREENEKYRQLLKSTLAASPETLKRFVNFMSNPDEATAVEQFGKGDKYFAAAVLLATMPGLPMFGHGQIEGFEEKYGMEFSRAQREEALDEGFAAYHEHLICPLLHQRYLFSGVENFALYDFVVEGGVDEDVFCYSNRVGSERALVIVRNRSGSGFGRIHQACPKAGVLTGAAEPTVARTLGEALALSGADGVFYRFRDLGSGLEYLRSGQELCTGGITLAVGDYQYLVLRDFAELHDEDGTWRQLWQHLAGQPVADLEREVQRQRLRPLLVLFRDLLRRGLPPREIVGEEQVALEAGLADWAQLLGQARGPANAWRGLFSEILAQWSMVEPWMAAAETAEPDETQVDALLPEARLAALLWPLLLIRQVALRGNVPSASRALDGLLDMLLEEGLRPGLPPATAEEDAVWLKLLLRYGGEGQGWRQAALHLTADEELRTYLQIHLYQNHEWFNLERLAWLAAGLAWCEIFDAARPSTQRSAAHVEDLPAIRKRVASILAKAEQAGYRLDKFMALQ